MAAVTLDSILNFIIPILVWIFLGYILYKPFKEPLDKLFSKIGEWKENRQEEGYEENIVKSIYYE
jgi:hypothetical protein